MEVASISVLKVQDEEGERVYFYGGSSLQLFFIIV